MKSFIKFIFAFALLFQLGACTSNDPQQATDSGDMVEGSTGEFADATASDMATDEFSSDFGDDFGDDFATLDEPAPADSTDAGDAALEDDFANFDDTTTDGALTDAAPADDFAATDESAATDEFAATETPAATDDSLSNLGSDDWSTADSSTDTSTDAPATDELAGLGEDTSFLSDGTDEFATSSTSTFEETAPAYKPLNKMITTPYTKAGILVNGIYIARAGDNFDTVSQKIYGSSGKVDELRTVNSHLSSRDMVVGDKIYYNSPQRPADDSKVLVFYEDIGLNPEIYVAQSGDSIRAVGKQLLGNSRSWKELYATNMDVDSKDTLDEGVRLRYWAGDFAAPAAPVQAAATPEPTFEESAPPMPEEPDLAQNDSFVDDQDDSMEAGAAAGSVQPPPPPQAFQPPPPPPPVNVPPPRPAVEDAASDSMAAGDDTTALIAGAILLLAAVAMVIIIRKRKAKKNIEFHTATHTQID